ncbi:hypothetical protein VP01_715g5 [Puccinia sorghi]|uniref:Uncharacterized protein n=1 Tax=Puccinia sorghi TaxID=27349 RepID=A0A0L6UDC5_9BASI|nr:hypothetical protein VP01_715g5 [Puccinia sorghi]
MAFNAVGPTFGAWNKCSLISPVIRCLSFVPGERELVFALAVEKSSIVHTHMGRMMMVKHWSLSWRTLKVNTHGSSTVLTWDTKVKHPEVQNQLKHREAIRLVDGKLGGFVVVESKQAREGLGGVRGLLNVSSQDFSCNISYFINLFFICQFMFISLFLSLCCETNKKTFSSQEINQEVLILMQSEGNMHKFKMARVHISEVVFLAPAPSCCIDSHPEKSRVVQDSFSCQYYACESTFFSDGRVLYWLFFTSLLHVVNKKTCGGKKKARTKSWGKINLHFPMQGKKGDENELLWCVLLTTAQTFLHLFCIFECSGNMYEINLSCILFLECVADYSSIFVHLFCILWMWYFRSCILFLAEWKKWTFIFTCRERGRDINKLLWGLLLITAQFFFKCIFSCECNGKIYEKLIFGYFSWLAEWKKWTFIFPCRERGREKHELLRGVLLITARFFKSLLHFVDVVFQVIIFLKHNGSEDEFYFYLDPVWGTFLRGQCLHVDFFFGLVTHYGVHLESLETSKLCLDTWHSHEESSSHLKVWAFVGLCLGLLHSQRPNQQSSGFCFGHLPWPSSKFPLCHHLWRSSFCSGLAEIFEYNTKYDVRMGQCGVFRRGRLPGSEAGDFQSFSWAEQKTAFAFRKSGDKLVKRRRWSLGDSGGLSGHGRKVGQTRVVAGVIQTRLRSPRGLGLGSGGLSGKADAGVTELGCLGREWESMMERISGQVEMVYIYPGDILM